jgi:precorrin-3B synthase
MPTGDGLLARLLPMGSVVKLRAMLEFLKAAEEYGNGIIEITARGSVQVRGLTTATAPAFATCIAALNLYAPEGPVVMTAWPADESRCEVIQFLREKMIASLLEESQNLNLSPKLSIMIEGTETSPLSADIRLGVMDEASIYITAGKTRLGSFPARHAVAAVHGILRLIASHGKTARAHDAPLYKGYCLSSPILASPECMKITLPFGRTTATLFTRLLLAARNAGATHIITTAPNAMTLCGDVSLDRSLLLVKAHELGFIVSGDDPRLRISVCAGVPACASAHIPTHKLARELVQNIAGGEGLAFHVSGCSKGCAHPGQAAITLIGQEGGVGVVLNGRACDKPSAVFACEQVAQYMKLQKASP